MNDFSIDKRTLWKIINIKIGRQIKSSHVGSIINILFEELLNDLKDGKEIKIKNFGSFILKNTKPRKYHDVRYNRVMLSTGGKILKLTLPNLIKKKICQMLDIDKTFESDYE
jgi:nucleoid DNA-binding protein